VTSPGPDDFTRRLSTAATATGGRPQTSLALASSDLSHGEIQAVGGFARALQLATTAQLARDSGATTNFSADELNQLDTVGENHQQDDTDSRSFLERAVGGFQKAVSNTGSFLFDNPVTHFLGDTLDQIGNAVHYPFRLLSSAIDTGNDAEVDREMRADGYDPNDTTSYLAFMWSQGENLYHDLSGIRSHYGDDLVDKVIQFQRDPEQFTADLQKLAPAEQQKLIDLTNSDDWVRAADLMDRKHISPGRDLARLVLPEGAEDTALFTAISGSLDAAYTWFSDPTLILGKANRVIKTFDVLGRDIEGAGVFGRAARRGAAAVPYLANKRAGLQSTVDQAGIEALLRVDPETGKAVTKVGKAWERYLADATDLRAAHADATEAKNAKDRLEAVARRAGIYRAMDRRYGTLMGMLDEINGTRAISEAERWQVGDSLPFGVSRAVARGEDVGFPIPDDVRARITDLDRRRQSLDRDFGDPHSAGAGIYLRNQMDPEASWGDVQVRLVNEQRLLHEVRSGRPVYYTADGQKYEQIADESRLRTVMDNDHESLDDPDAFRLAKPARVTGVNTAEHAQTLTWNTDPITDLKDLTRYLGSTDGLIRMANGEPARRAMVMPGRLSYRAEQKAAADTRAARKTTNRALDAWDYTKLDMLPDESEIGLLGATAAQQGDAQFEQIRRSILTGGARARFERVNRRLTTTIPSVKRVDLTDGSSAKLVEQVARTYLTKADAARLASAYSLGNVAQRRQVIKGVIQQLFHASGLSRSEDGLAYMKQYLDDFDDVGRAGTQRYGLDDTDLITDRDGNVRRAALLQSQLKTSVVIPSMREMNFHATKLAASGFTRRTGLSSFHKLAQSDAMDYLLGAIKLGWITTIAGGLRNALDEMANFAAFGMGREVLAARAAFTRGTATVRAERRAASLQYVRDAKANGRLITEEQRREKIGQAYISHDEAGAALESARRGALDLENAPKAWDTKLESLYTRFDEARDAVRTAKLKLDALPTSGAGYDGAVTSAANAEHRAALEAQKRAEQALTEHRDSRAPLPSEAIAKVQERLDRAGVLSVPDAEKQLKRAEKELADARILESVVRHTVPLAFRYAADTINDVMVGKVLGKAMRVFGKKFAVTDEMVKYAEELTDRELVNTIRAGVFQSHYWDSGVDDRMAMALHRAGLKARSYAFRKRYDGWAEIEPDGGAGSEAWAKMLQLAFEDGASPAHAWLDIVQRMRRNPSPHPTTPVALPDDVFERIRQGEYEGVSAETRQELLDAHARMDDPLGGEFIDENGDVFERNLSADLHFAKTKAMTELLERELRNGRAIYYLPDQGARTDALAGPVILRNQRDLDNLLDDIVDWPGKDFQDTPFEHLQDPSRWQLIGHESKADLGYVMDEAKRAIVAHMQTPEMEHFRRYGEVFQQLRDGTPATTDTLREQALEEYADRLSAHLLHATAGRDGTIPEKLLDKLTEAKDTGMTPDSTWLVQEIDKAQRPEKVLGQQWAPYNPAHELGELPRGYTQMMATAYEKVVTDQINALSRNPLMTALYINARRNTLPWAKKLEDAGWSKEAATEVVKRQAIRQAELEALKHIDNPYVQSQASLVVRNYATFIRAQEDWLRRWGRTIKDNPQVIRQAQLLIHGGESAGHVELDDQGDLTFTYPGGALMSGVINKFFGASALPGGLAVPITSELSSKVMYLNPSLDNPIGLTATPLLSIPLDAIFDATLGPDDALLRASLDKAVNGELGAGRSWMEKLLPSWANRIWQAFGGDDDPASAYGQAWSEAMAQLEASGRLDDPYFQTSTGRADLQHQVSIAVRNNLTWKALFGLFAPAAPQLTIGAEGSLPHDDGEYGKGVKADWVYHEQGLKNLRDEARQMASQYGYEQARAMWTATHPGELIYFDSARTEVNTPGAVASASIAAAKYIEGNQALFAKYGGQGGVAAYLIPQGRFGTKDGEFSDVAYQAQLESGIRTYKSLSDYFVDVITSRGARDYYAAKDAYDRKHAAAVEAGDKARADQLEQQWAAEKAKISKANPLLAERFAQYAADSAGVANALSQLQELVGEDNPEIQAALGSNRVGIAALLQARESYQTALTRLEGRRTRQANREREALKTRYETRVREIAGGPDPETGADRSAFPELADLARGVFRLPS